MRVFIARLCVAIKMIIFSLLVASRKSRSFQRILRFNYVSLKSRYHKTLNTKFYHLISFPRFNFKQLKLFARRRRLRFTFFHKRRTRDNWKQITKRGWEKRRKTWSVIDSQNSNNIYSHFLALSLQLCCFITFTHVDGISTLSASVVSQWVFLVFQRFQIQRDKNVFSLFPNTWAHLSCIVYQRLLFGWTKGGKYKHNNINS